MSERQFFLRRCKRENILPNFILNKGKSFESFEQQEHPYHDNIKRAKNMCLKKMLNLEIKICNFALKKLTDEVSNLFVILRHLLNDIRLYEQFEMLVSEHSKIIRRTKQDLLDKKFKNLERKQKQIEFFYDKSNVVNLTNTDIPEECYIVWSMGSNFGFPTPKNKIPIFDMLADIEGILSLENKNLVDEKRAQVTNDITQFLKKNTNISKTNKILFDAQIVTRKFLKNNPNLCITKADKGNRTVVTDITDYRQKMTELLGDLETYEILDDDPTKKTNKKCHKIIDRLKNKNLITNQKKLSLKINNPIPPRIYGLPKIHKPNIPLRPIVSTINSPAYSLSKFCCEILKPMTNNSKFNIKNSFIFKDTIKNLKLANDDVLASLDVVALFTNVPLDMAKSVISERWSEIEIDCILTKDEFLNILDICTLDNNYFKYQDRFYRQKFGLAMGNPLSPILADIVLEKLFNEKLPFLERQPTFIYKYVDDIILATTDANIEKIKILFNAYHNKLKFTVEREDNNKSIPFLDLKLFRQNQTIKTEWFKKEIAANTILNFISTHPFTMKRNVALSFIKRVLYLTDSEFRQKNIIKIKKILERNNYPIKLINKLISKTIYTYRCKKPKQQDMKFGSMTYVPNLTEKINRTLKNNSDKLMVATKISNKAFDGYTKLKDKIPDEKKDGLIYKISCKNCVSCYIGETGKTKLERVNQHKKDVDNINKYPNQTHTTYRSALVKHAFENKHEFDFENAVTLDYEPKKPKRLFKEACHIWTSNNPVNYKVDINRLQTN